MGIGQAVIGGVNAVMSKIGNNQSNTSGGSQGAGNQGSSGNGTSSKPTTTASDPAYAAVSKDLYLYDLLKPMVKGSEGDIDWTLATGGSNDGKSGAAFLESMLTLAKQSFAQQSGGGLATTTYQKILDNAVTVSGI